MPQVKPQVLPEVQYLECRAEGIRGAERSGMAAAVEKQEGFPDRICRMVAIPFQLLPRAERRERSVVAEGNEETAQEGKRQTRVAERVDECTQDRIGDRIAAPQRFQEVCFQGVQEMELFLRRGDGVIGDVISKTCERIQVGNMRARTGR